MRVPAGGLGAGPSSGGTWHSTGSLAEPGIELQQSAVFQPLAPSHGAIPPLPFAVLTSRQTACSCVRGQLPSRRFLTPVLQMFEVPFPPCFCELEQRASGMSPMQPGRREVCCLNRFLSAGLLKSLPLQDFSSICRQSPSASLPSHSSLLVPRNTLQIPSPYALR